jgi:uncharacterized protein (DUF1786 family)
VRRIELRDFDFNAIAEALGQFGLDLRKIDAVAVAVFDHGNSPPGYSDRQFRFDYLDQRIRAENRLSAFAYRREEVPNIMTRLQSVVQSAEGLEMPLVVMDTAPAAVLGATYDPMVGSRDRVLIANVGNFHTLAFRLGPGGIEAVFEHHTGFIDLPKLETLLKTLALGTLRHEDVFGDQGHGALVWCKTLSVGREGVRGSGNRPQAQPDAQLQSEALLCSAFRRHDDRRLLWPAGCSG